MNPIPLYSKHTLRGANGGRALIAPTDLLGRSDVERAFVRSASATAVNEVVPAASALTEESKAHDDGEARCTISECHWMLFDLFTRFVHGIYAALVRFNNIMIIML